MLKSFLFGASADWAQSRQDWQCFALVERICAKMGRLDNISTAPVWNFLGETKDSFLTFYAKK